MISKSLCLTFSLYLVSDVISNGDISTKGWAIYNNGTVWFTGGTIGGITINSDRIGERNGSWYISKNAVYLPNLRVTAGGAVVYNVPGSGSGSGTGGISSSRGGVGIGNNGRDYVNFDKTKAGPTTDTSLTLHIKEIVAKALGG